MKKLILQILAAIAALWLAVLFVQGVKVEVLKDSNFFGIPLTQQWQIIMLLGATLGLLNFFVKPLLKVLALPLEIITLGLFSIVINMGLIWFLDKVFRELSVPFWLPMIQTTLMVWALSLFAHFLSKQD